MNRSILIAMVFLFVSFVAATMAVAQEEPDEAMSISPDPDIQIIVLEDGTEEMQEIIPTEAYAPMRIDERYLSIRANADRQIQEILEQIRQQPDSKTRAALHRQIESIKYDEEIERITMVMEDAGEQGDEVLADELAAEIEHIEIIRQRGFGRETSGVSEQAKFRSEGGLR